MIGPYPYFGFPRFRRPYPYYPPNYYSHNVHANPIKNEQKSCSPNIERQTKQEKCNDIDNDRGDSEECFEIFGLKLHFDDLLIVALLFFLYQEEVKDTYLYISLILLLLS